MRDDETKNKFFCVGGSSIVIIFCVGGSSIVISIFLPCALTLSSSGGMIATFCSNKVVKQVLLSV